VSAARTGPSRAQTKAVRRAAAIYTLIHSAKLSNVDPQVWLAYVLARLTAASAIGELAAFFPRRALAAMSANSKNCRRACAQHNAAVIAPRGREGSYISL
jgi:hypothetical protein